MSWFSRIEERTASFIERAFAGMFPSDVEPAQIARKLVATMEARSEPVEGGGVRAPDRYDVFINTIDFSRLREHRAYLETEWAALLSDVAQRVGIRLAGAQPSVSLAESDDVPPGAIRVRAGDDAQQRGPRFVLRIVKGLRDATFSVDGAMRVGRNAEAEIALQDPSVSRNHALLDVRRGRLVVRDSGSTNGTFVNGLPVQESPLRAGDVVAFGKTQLRVENAP